MVNPDVNTEGVNATAAGGDTIGQFLVLRTGEFLCTFHNSMNSHDTRKRNHQGRREEIRTGPNGECRRSLGVNFGGVRGWVRPSEGRNSAAREVKIVRAVGRNSFARSKGN